MKPNKILAQILASVPTEALWCFNAQRSTFVWDVCASAHECLRVHLHMSVFIHALSPPSPSATPLYRDIHALSPPSTSATYTPSLLSLRPRHTRPLPFLVMILQRPSHKGGERKGVLYVAEGEGRGGGTAGAVAEDRGVGESVWGMKAECMLRKRRGE